MSEYIKREDAIKEANTWSMFGNDNLESRLKALPSVDVAEVRHGHWEQDGHHIRCSECGTYFCDTDREGDSFPKEYCPNCGARMDKKEQENE